MLQFYLFCVATADNFKAEKRMDVESESGMVGSAHEWLQRNRLHPKFQEDKGEF